MIKKTVITYSFCESFLDRFVDDLVKDYVVREGLKPSPTSSIDLSRLAIVFGGHRPALFVKRALSKKIGKPFFPPRFFSIDEFMGYIAAKHDQFSPSQDLDQCYLMYTLAQQHCPQLLLKHKTFAQFLPWAREILSFIEQLDLECVDNKKLCAIEKNAVIGYDVPEDINNILKYITILREAYHQHMLESGVYTRGFQYRRAQQVIAETQFEEFDDILFANFFYFNRSEERVVKILHDAGKARLFFQGDQRRWPVFERIASTLKTEILEGKEVVAPGFDLKLYRGFDAHSQICQLREILKTVSDLDQTVIVLSNPDNIIPLLSEIGPMVKDFNISMGYPLKRSSLVSCIEKVFAAQQSRDGRGYYTQDYLNVLKHPLVKNLMLFEDAQVVRVLVHKIEEVLTGLEESDISGCIFLTLDEVLECGYIFETACGILQSMGQDVTADDLKKALQAIHEQFFSAWEVIDDFETFSKTLRDFLDVLINKSVLGNYPLNIRIASKIYDITDELSQVNFSGEQFPAEDIFRIFSSKIEREIVALIGSPLKGLQILGLFETRALNFDHVIVMDANEGLLPHLNIYEALIPREVMISLNLDRLEQEEEIQRYGFMRLISSAENVHLLYQESRERERSRFVEELVWEKEKACGQTEIIPIVRSGFQVSARSEKRTAQKTPAMIEFLRHTRYSASSINTYLRDPMDFYDRYVLGLREQDDLLDEPENRQVGTFLHDVLEEVFKGFVGRKPVIDQKFVKYFWMVLNSKFDDMFGRSKRPDTFFLKRVIDERMKRFLEKEAERCETAVKEVMFVEEAFEDVIKLDAGDLRFIYKVDRIDRLIDGTIMLLDYKTGSVDVMPGNLDEVDAAQQDRQQIFETVKSFQLPLYFHYLLKNFPGQRINAGLYNLRDCQIKEFLGRKTGYDLEKIDSVFLGALNMVTSELLDINKPFIADD